MKNLIVSTLILLTSLLAQAMTVSSGKESIAPSDIDQVIRLVDKYDPSATVAHKKLSIVVADSGMSSDVSPRYTVYLSYVSLSETGNIKADFKITDQPIQFLDATRKSAGIYEVIVNEARGSQGFVQVTYTIDARKMFSDEAKARKKCGDDFCDLTLQTTVSVTEKVAPVKW